MLSRAGIYVSLFIHKCKKAMKRKHSRDTLVFNYDELKKRYEAGEDFDVLIKDLKVVSWTSVDL